MKELKEVFKTQLNAYNAAEKKLKINLQEARFASSRIEDMNDEI